MSIGSETPVLIVGGGSVGLSTSILLSRQGVPCTLIERNPGTSTAPRAHGIGVRTAELLRQWGVLDELGARGAPAEWGHRVVWTTTLGGEELGRREDDGALIARRAAHSPAHAFGCPQPLLEPVLRELASSLEGAEIRFGHELVGFTHDDSGVLATIRDPDGDHQPVRAQFLVAADGSASGVRHQLGVAMDGPADLGHFLNVHFRADLRPWTQHRPAILYWVMSGDQVGVFVALDGSINWSLQHHLAGEERPEDYDEADCRELVRRGVGAPELDVEILGRSGWRMGSQVARHLRAGRVLLVGDAAHRTTPAGALGMNTGIQSAHNLAWKLAAVLHGWGHDALLDTYETERQQVALRNVVQSRKSAEAQVPIARAASQRDLESARRAIKTVRAPGDTEGQDLGITYTSGTITPDGTTSTRSKDPVRDYQPDARPGARAPHLWLHADRARISTLDLFDRQPVLLTAGPSGGWIPAARAAAESAHVPLRYHTVGDGGDLLDPTASFPAAYGLTPGGAVLVRPDGHVAWRSQPGDAAGAHLKAALRRLAGDGSRMSRAPLESHLRRAGLWLAGRLIRRLPD